MAVFQVFVGSLETSKSALIAVGAQPVDGGAVRLTLTINADLVSEPDQNTLKKEDRKWAMKIQQGIFAGRDMA